MTPLKNFDDIKARMRQTESLLRDFQEQEIEHFTNRRKAKFPSRYNCCSEEVPCSTKNRGNQKQTSNQESIKKSDDDLLKACGELQTF
ncbi:hypothetical protein Tco_1554698 [Tanacetum coccineum]